VLLRIGGVAQEHDLERLLERGALGGRGAFPEARHGRTEEGRLAPSPHDERAVGLGEGQPVLEVGARAEGPVLVVEAALLRGGPGLDDDGVPALLGEQAREAPLEVGDVVQIEAIEAHGGYPTAPGTGGGPVYNRPGSCPCRTREVPVHKSMLDALR
jgi:hypothetical protein